MKQTMKRTISLLLSIVMALSVFAGLRLPAFALDDEVLEIRTVDDWNRFSASGTLYNVDSGFYMGKTVRLLADVGPVTTRFGEKFLGTFDGGGHTLTVNIGNGLFEAISNGGVKNLTVAGAVSSQATGALVETVKMNSDCVISNVRITADVSSPGGAVAGFVGWCEEYSSLVIENSAFEGGLFGNTAAGFVNFCTSSSVTIKNSVFCGYCENAKNFSTVGYTADESPSSATIQNVKTNTPDVYGGLEWWRTPLYNTALPTDAGYSPAAAESLINRIGTVKYTAECKAKIDKARAAYNKLTADEKQQVTNFNTLQAAEAAFAAFNTGKALQLTSAGAAANVEGAQQSSVWFGNYKQSSDGNGGYNVDPVKWRVLSNAAGRLFLLSDRNLDVVRYNEERTSVTWETCTLRKWLNGYDGHPYDDTFIGSAFSDKETSAIAETTVEDNNTNAIVDKMFLLSLSEAANTAYGFTDNYDSTDSRVAKYTAYVVSGGHTGSYIHVVREAVSWWLRSPGFDNYWSSAVGGIGYLNVGGSYVDSADVAVRPAFNLNLNAVLFTSAAVDGKPGDGALTQIADYSGSEWKLTLPDESRSFAVTETAATAAPGETVTLTYTGATVGTNEYISAILTDETGAALYYGRLTQPDAADGALTVSVPAGLAPGSSYTLKVFSEQYNGDYKTDFASAFCDVTLTTPTQLEIDKAAAKAELENYKDPADYRAAQKTELESAINDGKAAIDAATDADAVATALAGAKEALDAIKTDAELTAEETLAAAKAAAKEELAAYKNADDYRTDEQAALAEAIAAGEAAIDAAADADGIAAALAAAEEAIDAIKTDAELTAEEAAAAQAAADPAAFNAYKAGLKTVIDRFANEDDNAECAALIAQAKADLDALAYDETKSLNENINAATALVDQLSADLYAARHTADPGDPGAPHTPSVEVSPSIIITLFRVLVCFFRDIARDLTELTSHFSR